MNKELGRMVRGRATTFKARITEPDRFFKDIFDSAERAGESLRVGDYRSAPVNGSWAALKDGAEGPFGMGFTTEQKALDWMVSVECNKFAAATREANAVVDSWSEIKQATS